MSDAIANADALAARGRWREAIDELTAANRHTRNASVEARLVELRRDACAPSDASTAARWPKRARRRFARGGLPEVAPNRLSAAVLRSAIRHHGCLVVRGLLKEPRVSQLVASVDAAFDAFDARAADPSASSPWFVPFDPGPGATVPRDWIRQGEGVLAVDSPPAMFDVLETFEDVGIRTLVNEYFGEAPTILSTKLTLRRVEPLELFDTDYHQDGAFLGGDIRTLDIWVTLSDCGVDAPGIDVVAKRFEGVITTQREGAEFDWTIPAATVDEIAPGLVHRPVFAAGDAMIFDHLLVHRTARDPAMHRNRYAIEAWFSTMSKYPASAIPIAY